LLVLLQVTLQDNITVVGTPLYRASRL